MSDKQPDDQPEKPRRPLNREEFLALIKRVRIETVTLEDGRTFRVKLTYRF